jgi:hypothetical protein
VTRNRITHLSLGLLTLVGSVGVGLVGSAASAPPAAATTPAPASCTFDGLPVPVVLGATPGDTVQIACTGLTPLHPYLLFETSLLLAIDPKAAPLLQGNVVSLPGLLALISALPEINPRALTFPHTNLKGDLNENYTLPKTHAPDRNATCPPSAFQFSVGLIGCGLAMIDLTTFKTVAAGSGLVQFGGALAPGSDASLSLSASSAAPGATVKVSDAPGTKLYWWLSTITALVGLLGGGSAPSTTQVDLSNGKRYFSAGNTVTLTPAVYNAPTLTPPKISGSFKVPAVPAGAYRVIVNYSASLEGFQFTNTASAPLHVS